jgi:2-polyprenyl-6-methoxyphenol hydroxylase-like FAD-dependent oxidoreductase
MRPKRRDGTPALSLHRGDLQLLLQAQLSPETLRLGFTVTGATDGPKGVELVSQLGECLTGSALIGADGLNSRVRHLYWDDGAPRFCGYTGWRSVVPWIPHRYEGNWLSESWGEGKRFGISPLGGNRCYWYATANRPAIANRERETTREELLLMFGHWHSPIPELIAATPLGTVTRNDIFDRRNQPSRGSGRITLLGDAAHAMTPNLGQGACTALEDAWVLARELSDAPSPAQGLRRYEQARRLRIGCISRASRLLGQIIQLEHPVATAARDLMLRATPDFCSDWAMRPLFGFRA